MTGFSSRLVTGKIQVQSLWEVYGEYHINWYWGINFKSSEALWVVRIEITAFATVQLLLLRCYRRTTFVPLISSNVPPRGTPVRLTFTRQLVWEQLIPSFVRGCVISS